MILQDIASLQSVGEKRRYPAIKADFRPYTLHRRSEQGRILHRIGQAEMMIPVYHGSISVHRLATGNIQIHPHCIFDYIIACTYIRIDELVGLCETLSP